jgi:hypothetical protein
MMRTIFHLDSGSRSGQCRIGVQPRTRSAFMRKDLLALGLGMILSSVAVCSSFGAAGNVTLSGHVPAVVANERGTALINTLITSSPAAVHISPPPPPYGTPLSSLNGGNPNGAWRMFIQDDAPLGTGLLANGWILSLATADFVGTAADLEVLMTTTNSTVFVGQTATFVTTVTNWGPSISSNVSVVNDLPLTVTVIGTNATQGSVSRSGATLLWNVGTLNVGSGAALVVTVQPHGTAPLVSSATGTAATSDPNPDEDTASATVNIAQLSTTLTPSLSNGLFNISIPDPTNPPITVVIQANSDLVSTNWVNVYTGQPPINFTDPTTNSASRFYRALLFP